MFGILLYSGKVLAEENIEVPSLTVIGEEKEYGTLYGAPYSETDDSEWLILELGGRGFRIINDEGSDIILIDQFGMVYINGEKCNPAPGNEKTDFNNNFSYGFMYFLIIISLGLCGYNLATRKK